MDTELLKEIGLTDGEIKVYLALFKLGPSSTGPIVKESKVHSSKVYPILDRLIDKGLVSFIKEGKKTIYTSNSPDTILSFLDKKQTKIEEQKKSAKGLVKELELMKTIETAKTEATVFKGVKGLKTAYRTAIKDVKKGDLTYEMFLPPVKDPLINFFINHVKSISKSGIKQRMLFNETCPEATAVEKFARVNVKYISQEFISPAEICVYGNNTIISTTAGKEYITFLVKNKEIADSFKSQFNYIWNQEVNTYFGLEGVKAVFDEILNYKEFYFIGGNWGIIKYYKEFFEESADELIPALA